MKQKNWPIVSINTVCNLIVDCVNRTAPIENKITPYRMIRTTDIRNDKLKFKDARYVNEDIYHKWTRRARVEHGDVLLTREAPIGEVCRIANTGEHYFLGQRIMQYRADNAKIDPLFLYYSFCSSFMKQQFLSHDGSGSVVSHIRVEDCHHFKIPIAPRKEQEKIGQLLASIDNKIDLNRRTNETLEAMARALFRDWFVDFGPTRAKRAGEAPYLAPELWELFPERLDNEGKPEGWRIAFIDSLCRITSGKRPPNKETLSSEENPIPVYGGNGISWFTKDVLFDQPFLITGRVGTLGTVFRVNEKCWVSDNALCLFPRIDSYFEYIYFIVSSINFQILNSGSTQPLLTQSSLSSQECILPAEEIITIFHAQVSVWFKIQQQLEKETGTLSQLRDLLLPKLMSGEISIRDAEKMVEDAA
ncbi:restriction endonuclease subunit S [Acetobacter sp. DmW_043]|uniref:restriction endonuclease subunit S n=1 Tax=Acetobacter sp. DmW_043 TaxID=1670658 RepID=UPI000A3AF69D|nr:restriction endonuclease subunit S [Acetobacter sp. DmW_043]